MAKCKVLTGSAINGLNQLLDLCTVEEFVGPITVCVICCLLWSDCGVGR